MSGKRYTTEQIIGKMKKTEVAYTCYNFAV
jgi:hypothetical protein